MSGFSNYDAWKLQSPPEYYEDPVEEVEGEPVETEEDGHPVITFPNGKAYHITEITEGAFIGDFAIIGPGFYSDGHASEEIAVQYLLKMEWQTL
jgi:hypothetical protein